MQEIRARSCAGEARPSRLESTGEALRGLRRRTGVCAAFLCLSAALVMLAFPEAPPAAALDGDAAREEPGKAEGKDAPPAGASLRGDLVVLSDGTEVQGTILADGAEGVILRTETGDRVFLIAEIERAERRPLDTDALAVFEKLEPKATKVDHWRKLATLCQAHDLHVERRRCLERIRDLDPADEAVRRELGEVLLDGVWLTPFEVRKKLDEGYTIRDGTLVPQGKTVVAEADPAALPETIRLLERTELTEREAKELERDWERRSELIEKVRRQREREYEGVPWSRRHKIQTRNFEIQCNSTRRIAVLYSKIMELIRANLSGMFNSPIHRHQRSTVFIYSSQEEFMTNDDYGRWGGRGLGGYYIPSTGSITAFHGTFGFTGTTFGVLAHEGTHYYQGLVLKGGFDNVPIWLIEGLAVYFGDGSRFDPEKARMTIGEVPRDRLSTIQEKIQKGRHTPIRQLVGMTKFSGFNGSHYADSWALIYFLVKSSKKGERLMQEYWATGLERRLEQRDFLRLAEKYFGSVEELEKQYVDYIRKLRLPSAGEVKGDYFISDLFRFQFRAPSSDWKFFEDTEDKKLLVGLLLPGSSARIRIYFENNMYSHSPKQYMEQLEKYGRHLEDFAYEEVMISGLPGFRATYVDSGFEFPDIEIELDPDGNVVVTPSGDKIKKKEPRKVTSFLLVQMDGVAKIECSAAVEDAEAFVDAFAAMNDNFSLLLTRRW